MEFVEWVISLQNPYLKCLNDPFNATLLLVLFCLLWSLSVIFCNKTLFKRKNINKHSILWVWCIYILTVLLQSVKYKFIKVDLSFELPPSWQQLKSVSEMKSETCFLQCWASGDAARDKTGQSERLQEFTSNQTNTFTEISRGKWTYFVLLVKSENRGEMGQAGQRWSQLL